MHAKYKTKDKKWRLYNNKIPLNFFMILNNSQKKYKWVNFIFKGYKLKKNYTAHIILIVINVGIKTLLFICSDKNIKIEERKRRIARRRKICVCSDDDDDDRAVSLLTQSIFFLNSHFSFFKLRW